MENEIKKYIEEHKELDDLFNQKELTLEQVSDYVIEKAKDKLDNKPGAIRDDIVFGWVEEFINTYDKAAHDKEVAEAKKKEEERQARIKEEQEKEQEKKENEKVEKYEELTLFDI